MKKYLRYFSSSLKRYPNRYVSLVFVGQPVNDEYHVYLCPICLTNFLAVDRSGYYESSEFTADHFPPDSVGGTLTVLVCKNCNYQEKGQPKKILRRGDVIKCPPNVPHWHGASADTAFIQVAITGREKGETIWLDSVNDDEYNK